MTKQSQFLTTSINQATYTIDSPRAAHFPSASVPKHGDTLNTIATRLAVAPRLLVLVALVTAQGLEANSGTSFRNVAPEAGLDAPMRCGGEDKKWIFEVNGSGAAWLDYDNDGWLDLLIVNGSTVEELRRILSGKPVSDPGGGVFLYRNLGTSRFEDVTSDSGLSNPFWGTGANAADFDNDGRIDILITTIGKDLLYKNNGDGKFTEISEAAGLSRNVAWHTGSSFGDYDGDGHLDLYIAGYLDIHAISLEEPVSTPCEYKGLPVFCGPVGLKGEKDILYHNNGDGTFTDVTHKAGVQDADTRFGFGVVFEDFNEDDKVDIFIANDSGPNYLYTNSGNGKFEESGLTDGVALNADGDGQADMGIAMGDYDNDGKLDIVTTTFSDDYFPFFKRYPSGFFEDSSFDVGLTEVTTPLLGWACSFADLDNDGDKDLWFANGHVYSEIGKVSSSTYFQPFSVFDNRKGRFHRVKDPSIPENSYRGGAQADFNNDGRMDVVVLPIAGTPVLLENNTPTANAWLGLKLVGKQSNRGGIGAEVQIEHCDKVQFDRVRNGGGYLSRNDGRLHFGLGACRKVDRVVVRWPRGKVQILEDVTINQYVTVVEPL